MTSRKLHIKNKKQAVVVQYPKTTASFDVDPKRTIEWMGSVDEDTYINVSSKIKTMLRRDRTLPIHLIITSPGGTTGISMGFHDLMKKIVKPKLHTIGSGDVDSAAIILFLTGEKRTLTRNTTMLLHTAGRTFNSSRRFTTTEINSMLQEDTLKDRQYASVLADASDGRLSSDQAMSLMEQGTVLDPAMAVRYGLAHEVV